MGGQNPLKNLGTDDFIEFADAYGFVRGGVHGDDVIYYNPNKRIEHIKITLNKKDGTPPRTVQNMIWTSGIAKSEWQNWFRKKRYIKRFKDGS